MKRWLFTLWLLYPLAGCFHHAAIKTPTIDYSAYFARDPVARAVFQLDQKSPINVFINTSVHYVADLKRDEPIVYNEFHSGAEKEYVEWFKKMNSIGRQSEVSLIDRNVIDKILSEQKLSLSGAISRNTQITLGRLSGASHFIDQQCSVYSVDKTVCYRKLIDIETGKILETETVKSYKEDISEPAAPQVNYQDTVGPINQEVRALRKGTRMQIFFKDGTKQAGSFGFFRDGYDSFTFLPTGGNFFSNREYNVSDVDKIEVER